MDWGVVRFPNCIVYYQSRGWGPWLLVTRCKRAICRKRSHCLFGGGGTCQQMNEFDYKQDFLASTQKQLFNIPASKFYRFLSHSDFYYHWIACLTVHTRQEAYCRRTDTMFYLLYEHTDTALSWKQCWEKGFALQHPRLFSCSRVLPPFCLPCHVNSKISTCNSPQSQLFTLC